VSRRAIVVRCLAVALLLVGLGVGWRLAHPRSAHSWKDVREGVTTEAEVEAWFGPPAQSGVMVLTPDMARMRGIPERPDGQPVNVALKHWWYDDDHFVELEINDEGMVICYRGPAPCPPRSAVRRWWREHKPDVFE
jgi:hypothetical protein